jgi:hypothetical protein
MSSKALDLFDHLRCCICWKHPYKEVNMIWLDGYFKYRPTKLLTLSTNKTFTFLSYCPD